MIAMEKLENVTHFDTVHDISQWSVDDIKVSWMSDCGVFSCVSLDVACRLLCLELHGFIAFILERLRIWLTNSLALNGWIRNIW